MKKFTVLVLSVLFVCAHGNLSRIVGGTAANDGEFPHQVSIRDNSNNVHHCGGSIISTTHILTAAHCFEGRAPSEFNVVAGTNTWNSSGNSYRIQRIINHSGYKFPLHDISILKLSSQIAINAKQKIIALPQQGESTNDGVTAVASGWGWLSFPPTGTPTQLQKVTLSVVSNQYCQQQLQSKKRTIYKTNICTFVSRGKGTCHGDSGGPLVSNGKLIGIVSYGESCAIGYPDVFTRVSEYITWIKQNQV